MGYNLQAIVGSQKVLQEHSEYYTSAVVAPLAIGLALIPITDELLDEVGASGDSGKFYKFTPAMAAWLRAISATGPAAYVEAEYFGGAGGQGSTVWAQEQQVLAPTHDPEAINIALRLFGVFRGTFHDEFEAVGLPRHRDTNDWLGDAIANDRKS